MKKFLLIFGLCVIFSVLVVTSAFALTVSLVDSGGNTVSINSVIAGSGGNWYVDITEDYLTVNPVWLEFTQQPGATYADTFIEKTVTNSTNLTWRDFHMKLWVQDKTGAWTPSPNNDGLYFTGITSSGPFAETWYNPNQVDELWLWNGVWNTGETYNLAFSVDGWGWTGGSVPNFRLEQWPTDTGGPSVPEPASILLMLIGIAGIAIKRVVR